MASPVEFEAIGATTGATGATGIAAGIETGAETGTAAAFGTTLFLVTGTFFLTITT